jgi:nitronate monooxygenase
MMRAVTLFDVDLPIVAGPMAGGPSTPALAAAVCGAGALGSLGAGYLSPDAIRAEIGSVREATPRPFGVNLFAPSAVVVNSDQVATAIAALAPYRDALGLPPQRMPEHIAEDFDAQLDVVCTERVPVFTFTFGLLPTGAIERLHRSGSLVGGTATTPAEAKALEESGVDFVVAQGAEAGGHRGSFLPHRGDNLVGTLALVPQVRDSVAVPVIAAGGIMDGRGINAAITLGASAAQLGTVFLLCLEAGTSAPYRDAVRRAEADDTVITSAFSGRPARGIVNRMTTELAGVPGLPPYPVMNALTRDLRRAAAQLGTSEFLSLWCGQGVGLVRETSAHDLVAQLAREMRG